MKQHELDLLEMKVLDDIFGGHNRENLVFHIGIFKYDMYPKVQEVINRVESILLPIMDDNGYINMSELKKYIEIPYITLPDGNFRPIELYNWIAPLLLKMKGVINDDRRYETSNQRDGTYSKILI